MPADERLYPLLDRWLAEADAGRLLSAADLCRNCPDLLPEADEQIAVLRQFHVLAQPNATTLVEVQAGVDTTAGGTRDLPGAPLPASGATFGRYHILAELGRGGMGVVCKARDMQLNREVALKLMRPDVAASPNASHRFLREARAMAAVRNDHVVEIYDYGQSDDVHFVAMPLLAGETLEARLDRQSPLPAAEVIRIGVELADGLAAVHAKGLIHRDLKPSNVWLEAPRGRVKLLDFGLARDPAAGDGVTCPGMVVGTPEYVSPEQANGLDLDARSDLFSLGSVLYRAASGRSAFTAPTLTATLAAVAEKEPLPACKVNPAIPAALSDLIQRLHRKFPAERPASAAEVIQQLRPLTSLREPPTIDWPPGDTHAGTPRRGWSKRARFAAAGTLTLLLGVGLIVYFSLRDPTGEGNAVPAKGPPEPLRVRSLEVLHLEHFDDKRTRPRRLLGTESFAASPDDDIKVSARLSRPAYCYLIVFRPDGVDEVLYPQSMHEPPVLTDEPRYPTRDRSKVYGLTDGTGLWLVTLVASDNPLPAYADWRKQHPGGPWLKSDGEANVVWLDDGNWLEALTPGGVRNRGGRGEKEAAGAAPIVRVVDWLKAQIGGTVSAVGFTVEAKK
jgi:serine/threonine protein kinase